MKIHSIVQLTSVNSLERIQALNALGIHTIRDMAEYDGCRHAEYLMSSFSQGNAAEADLENYVEEAALTESNIETLDTLDIVNLLSVSEPDAEQLGAVFQVTTLAQLAKFPPFEEAKQIVLENVRGTFYEKPSAPRALIPKLIGSTHTQARYSNYVKETEYVFSDYALLHFSDSDEPEPAGELIDIFYRSQLKFHLGYLASIHQKWINDGTHLGEIVHSLALAPGESRNIAVLDWYRRQRSSRDEDTTISERLRAEFTQTRALNEVVQTTAKEHLYGSTEVDATTKTTGAGAVAGNAGGASAGASASGDLTSLIGLPVSAAGSGVASSANSIGGSLVYSNSSVQGTLKSETTGERSVTGELVQNISDATVQNASNVRSVMSTVVVEDRQSGRQRAQTSNVTNYNHSHALTVQYFEVLHRYRVDTAIDSLSPVLLLPFGPITFNIELIKNYWYLFGKAIKKLQPGRFFEYDQVIKDFNPENEAFDASGDLRVERIKITRTRTYSEQVRVKLTDSDPEVTLAITGSDMDDCLNFKMTGSSTYANYDVLALDVFDVSSFFTVDSFEIDEGIKATLSSDFTPELKLEMKRYLDDENKTPKVSDLNRDDNELGEGSNREALREDVDNNLFTILNNEQSVDLTLNIEYTVADQNGQTQIVPQFIHKTYTYGVLKGEISEEIADVTAHINTYLATVADINPAEVIAEIEQYFNFHKYGFTKYLLANLEKEQIKDIIEHLGIFGSTETLALSALIDPGPLALTENMLIFKLKEDRLGLRREIGRNFFGSIKAPLFGEKQVLSGNGLKQTAVRKGRETAKYRFWGQPMAADPAGGFSSANLTLYVDTKANKAGKYAVEGSVDLIHAIGNRQFTYPLVLNGVATAAQDNQIQIGYTANGAIPAGFPDLEPGTIDWTLDFPAPSGESIADVVEGYVVNLDEYESTVRQRHHWASVFLPSSGVFAEAILGLSNASEYLNVRRFFNWQDSPIPNLAPGIAAVNVNQDYAQPLPGTLTPTVPVSVLNQIAPTQYPLPTSLASALQAVQNGSMFTDMSKTAELTSILGSLAELANNTAQLSGNLAGDAAANALNAAVSLGQQVAGMVGSAMNTSVADPPQTLTQQGAAVNHLEDVQENSGGGAISPTDQAAANGMGTPIPDAADSSEDDFNESFLPYIYAGADLTAERRAFDPALRNKSGVTSFSVEVPDLPAGGSIRWSVKPGQVGRYTLAGGATVQAGKRVDVQGLVPGLTKIDVEARDARGRVLQSLSFELCVPQFFAVDKDPAFDALLGTYGLIAPEIDEVLQVAKDACDIILREANVRTVWLMAPFSEAVPAHLGPVGTPAAKVTTVTLFGDPPQPALSAVAGCTHEFGVGFDCINNFGTPGPTKYNEVISVWAGAYDDALLPPKTRPDIIDDVTRELVATILAEGPISSPEKSLAIQIFGRLLGSTISHEIVHSLIGTTLSGLAHNIPAVPGDLMNRGFEASFEEKTGYQLLGPIGSGPLSTILFDKGMGAMSKPTTDITTQAYSLAELETHFPVPPTFV